MPAHKATWTNENGVYLVTCPEGCHLGTSARAETEAKAETRIRIHFLATRPLRLLCFHCGEEIRTSYHDGQNFTYVHRDQGQGQCYVNGSFTGTRATPTP